MESVLVVGPGGREEAIKGVVESPDVYVVVENDVLAGLEQIPEDAKKPLIIIGPETHLSKGLADDLREEGYLVLGASKAATQYEIQYSRGIQLAREAEIPHPPTFSADKNWLPKGAAAMEYVEGHNYSTYTIRADGTSETSTAVFPCSKPNAREIVDSILNSPEDRTINFQDRVYGENVIATAIVGSGQEDFVVLPTAQIYRKLLGGDKEPNTGGLVAYSPVTKSIIGQQQYDKIHEIFYDSLAAMKSEGVIYERAVLSLELVFSHSTPVSDPALIAYYARFGATATQVMLPLLTYQGIDVYRLFRSAAEGSVEKPEMEQIDIGHAVVSLALVPDGFPVSPREGDVIYGLDETYEGVTIQLADVTTNANGEVMTSKGGKALYVTGEGKTISEAARRVKAAIGSEAIHFAGNQYRGAEFSHLLRMD